MAEISKTAKASIQAGENRANTKEKEVLTPEKAIAELRVMRQAHLWPGTDLIDMLLAEYDKAQPQLQQLQSAVLKGAETITADLEMIRALANQVAHLKARFAELGIPDRDAPDATDVGK